MEGLDGSGKSTQIQLLKDYLAGNNIKYQYLHFPRTDSTSPVYGEMVANFLKGEFGDLNTVHPYLVSLLYAGDRKNAAEEISEWLNEGYLVLLDRYVYSNMAFQGAKCNSKETKQKLRQWIFSLEYEYYKIPKPQLSIFLHADFDFISKNLTEARKGDDRNYLQGKEDIHESSLDFQKQVEREYLDLINENNDFHLIRCIDDSGKTLPPPDIHQKVIAMLFAQHIL